MRALLALLVAVATLFASPAAHAGYPPPPAAVHVDNDSGFDVDVYVDGAWRGSVQRGDDRIFSTLPGHRNVRVQGRQDRFTLFDARVDLDRGRPTVVRVLPPTTRLTVTNDGRAPVHVTFTECSTAFWLLPGGRQTVDMASGTTTMLTSVYGVTGPVQVDSALLRLTPGASVSTRVGYVAPPPTARVTLTNYERSAVRVYVADDAPLVIPPGQTRTMVVGSGRHMVTVVQEHGPLLYNAPVMFEHAGQYVVEFRGGIRVAGSSALPGAQPPLTSGPSRPPHHHGAVAVVY